MAHADYRMKGPCRICEQIQFVGVCPHGMAERIHPAPTITPAEIEEALKKGIPGAEELDEKLKDIFRPSTPREEADTERLRKLLTEETTKRMAEWTEYAQSEKEIILRMIEDVKAALLKDDFEGASRLVYRVNMALVETTFHWWMHFKPPIKSVVAEERRRNA